jgi:hypothetical protein
MTDGPVEPPKQEEGEHDENATGILPKSLMAGKDFKPGDEIVLEVTRVGESDFEVRYAQEKGHEESAPHEEGAEESMAPEKGGNEMSSMMY